MIKKWLAKRKEAKRIKYENAKCGDKIKPHDWKYSLKTIDMGTNTYYKGEELTRKENIKVRKCKNCGRSEQWNSWFGFI